MSAIPELQAVTPLEAFDNVAEIFDETFENVITRSFRQRIYASIGKLVNPGGSILDISCGTGIDAIALAHLGYDVTAIDISPKMIHAAVTKNNPEKLPAAQFLVGSFEQLPEEASRMYDLVLSNFAGLNCVPQLGVAARQISAVTKPGGWFLATVMPPVSPWEVISGLARFNMQSAFRRLGKNTPATGFRGKTFTVYYHSLPQLLTAFSPWFEPAKIHGVNIISPPPHATTFLVRHAVLSRWLSRVERVVAPLPVFRAIGDHFLALLRRKQS